MSRDPIRNELRGLDNWITRENPDSSLESIPDGTEIDLVYADLWDAQEKIKTLERSLEKAKERNRGLRAILDKIKWELRGEDPPGIDS